MTENPTPEVAEALDLPEGGLTASVIPPDAADGVPQDARDLGTDQDEEA